MVCGSVYLLYLSPLGLTYYAVGGLAVLGLFAGATLLILPTVGVWERIARPWVSRFYGHEGRLGSSNIRRARTRTALTAASLMVGGAMILALQSTTGAYQHDIQNWIDKYVGGDLYVHSTVPMRADLQQRLEGIAGVAVATPLRYFDVQLRKPDGGTETVTYLAIEPTSYRQVTSVVFASGKDDPDEALDRLAAGDAVFISNVLAEKLALKQGDAISLQTRRGPKDFEVAAIVVNFQSSGNIVQGSWGDMRRYFGVNDVSAFLLKVRSGHTPEEVKESIDQLYGERRHLTVDSNQALKDQANSISNQVFGMFNVLVLIAMVVAALGVVNTLTMSVMERTQEIGMLRSIGMTRTQVRKMVLAEAGTLGFIGAALGLLLGLLLSRLFSGGRVCRPGLSVDLRAARRGDRGQYCFDLRLCTTGSALAGAPRGPYTDHRRNSSRICTEEGRELSDERSTYQDSSTATTHQRGQGRPEMVAEPSAEAHHPTCQPALAVLPAQVRRAGAVSSNRQDSRRLAQAGVLHHAQGSTSRSL